MNTTELNLIATIILTLLTIIIIQTIIIFYYIWKHKNEEITDDEIAKLL